MTPRLSLRAIRLVPANPSIGAAPVSSTSVGATSSIEPEP
jgi:hypothetical protein